MANADAWDTGWGLGKRAAQRSYFGGGKSSKPSAPVDKITTSDDVTLTPSAPLKSNYSLPASVTNPKPAVKAPKFHKGGLVRKTGLVKLKKGERVLTAAQAKQVSHKIGSKNAGARKRTHAKG